MALKSVTTAELRRELERREKGARRLQARRDKLAKKLATLDGELSALGLSARGGRKPGRRAGAGPKAGGRRATGAGRGGRKRARNEVSLPETICKIVRVGTTVTPAEVGIKVRKTGYKSTAAHFGMMVSNALSKDARFKRVSRGKYRRVK